MIYPKKGNWIYYPYRWRDRWESFIKQVEDHCLLWCLWRERNSRCFEDKERSISDLKLFFLRTLMDWLAALRNQSFSSFLDFLDSCNFCSWLFDPLYTPCVQGCSIFLRINKLLLIQKKKRRLALMSLAHMDQDNWLVNLTCALWIKPCVKWATCAQILINSS